MNNLLELKGKFYHDKNKKKGGIKNLPVNKSVKAEHVETLIGNLNVILDYWKKNTLIGGALVSVHYSTVIAKSNRISNLLICPTLKKSNDSVRGARFDGIGKELKHVFTHYVPLEAVEQSISDLGKCQKVINNEFGGCISHDDIELLIETKSYKSDAILSMSKFIGLVVDSHFVERFDIDQVGDEVSEQSIITIYKTKYKTLELFARLGIETAGLNMIDDTTMLLLPKQLHVLQTKAPYLIAMKTKDLSEITYEDIPTSDSTVFSLPQPKNEPIIGVIDTLFSKDVYFGDWVEFENMLDKDIPIDSRDYVHGTEVTSIIVDGSSINPDLNDGCGNFRVKHFGVATHGKFSSFTVLKSIRTAVAQNPHIKVWNISLGSAMEIHRNFISPEAAELDRIQCDYDVQFVVAGTNKPDDREGDMRIGAPADSLNSIVVNSVNRKGKPADYHRVGPVLSFFHKPDVSYYGGEIDEKIRVCTPTGEAFVMGTSFAAPWVTRKVAYLIYKMGFSREVAKALIVDAAAGWNRKDTSKELPKIGYGVVPIHIKDVLQSKDDEIKFFMSGTTDSYETYTYNIPVPLTADKHPFYARATLCYFPRCSRNQGVDYTDTEMDIHFGRVKEGRKGKPEIVTLNNNVQGNDGAISLYEGDARTFYRKWDNIKHISEDVTKRAIPRKKYDVGNWGLSIKIKERLTTVHDKEMPFGVVITLKEMNGKNRIDEFIKLCMIRGWIVNQIDVDNRVTVYNKAEENIDFD